MNIDVDFSRFVDNLQYMAAGMIGVFVIVGIIALATVVLKKLSNRSK